MNLDQPLRPKPPSWDKPSYSYGVENPHFKDHQTSNSKLVNFYSPDDFITETVQLDKSYLHQFFTSKPLLLGTDVVTSTSVKDGGTTLLKKQGTPLLKKQGRMEPEEDEELFHPEDHQPSKHSLLERMVLVHKNMRVPTTTTTASTTTTTRRTTTSEVPSKILDNVKIFKRYHIPAEVKISHSLRTKYGG